MTADRPEPPHDCAVCPRLVGYRTEIADAHPGWHGGPVPAFGDPEAWLLIVGLAPGKQGAHRTGRAFTGDASGHLLFEMLRTHGLSEGTFDNRPDDGLRLRGCMITNAVRCVPPANRPVGAEIAACRAFLRARIATLPRLRAILCLGRIAHDAVLRALDLRPARHPFAHGAQHELDGLRLFDCYHCSRYNLNTRRLTPEMFGTVFETICQRLSTTDASTEQPRLRV